MPKVRMQTLAHDSKGKQYNQMRRITHLNQPYKKLPCLLSGIFYTHFIIKGSQ